MTEAERLRNAVGLAMRAGKVLSGALPVEKALSGARVKLLILDAEASLNSAEKYAAIASGANIPMIRVNEAGAAIGKPERMILAVTDQNFANMILGANQRLNAVSATPGVDADGRKEL